MGKGRPEVQRGGSVGSFGPSVGKAEKNVGFSAERGLKWAVKEGSAISTPSNPIGQL